MKSNQKRDQMYAHIKDWEQSGQKRDEFCASRGITLHSFGYWRTRYLRDKNPVEAKFIPIKTELPSCIEVHYPNGTYIKLPSSSPLSMVKTLIGLG